RNLDQVKTLFFGNCAGLVDADRAVFVAVVSDQKDGAREDVLIHSWPVLGWCLVGLLETSGYYDFLSCVEPARKRISQGPPRETISRILTMGVCPLCVARATADTLRIGAGRGSARAIRQHLRGILLTF